MAECDKDEIFRALDNEFISSKDNKEYISMNDMYDLSLAGSVDSKEKREKLSNKLSLGHNNGKSLYKKLNSLKLTKKDVEKLLNE